MPPLTITLADRFMIHADGTRYLRIHFGAGPLSFGLNLSEPERQPFCEALRAAASQPDAHITTPAALVWREGGGAVALSIVAFDFAARQSRYFTRSCGGVELRAAKALALADNIDAFFRRHAAFAGETA